MLLKKFDEIKNVINKYSLKPASQRELPLLSLSCVAQGYTSLLRQTLGFSYESIIAMGNERGCHAMFNEKHIARKTGDLIKKQKNLGRLVLNKAKDIFNNISSQIKQIKPFIKKTPRKCLRKIIQLYPRYFLSLTIYNCFWRYIGNDIKKGRLSSCIIKKIITDREMVAKLYPQIEEIIKKCCEIIGRKMNFDGDLLRYFTHTEINQFLASDKNLTKKILKQLTLRRNDYLYLYIENKKEEVILSKVVIKKIKKQFFSINRTGIKKIKGFTAFSGKVKGKVFNLQSHIIGDYSKFKEGNILVTSMTHPKDIMLIKKSQAIVTDEGGVLCHAAIISRELKKPCIIGTKIATKILNDGDIVAIDGNKGIIRILKK